MLLLITILILVLILLSLTISSLFVCKKICFHDYKTIEIVKHGQISPSLHIIQKCKNCNKQKSFNTDGISIKNEL